MAKEYPCTVVETTLVGDGILRLRFEPTKKFAFQPGQFVSVLVPGEKPVKRLYSLAVSPNVAKASAYELCVRIHPQGLGSQFLKNLKVGDAFNMWAPYGDFLYRHPEAGRKVCFIATGTGVGPIRSFITSEMFLKNPPAQALALIGFQYENEIMYVDDFKACGVHLVLAISKAAKTYTEGFRGRVTDYLRNNPLSWDWQNTDYYLCGNPAMIAETRLLLAAFGVPVKAIHQEAFSNVPHHPVAA